MIPTDGISRFHHPTNSGKRSREDTHLPIDCLSERLKKVDRTNHIRKVTVAWLDLKQLVDAENNHENESKPGVGLRDSPLVYASSGCPCRSICLESDRPYTIGRSSSKCQFIFNDSHVSKRHCQIFLDASHRKVYLLNGVLSLPRDGVNQFLEEFRDNFLSLGSVGKTNENNQKEKTLSCRRFRFKASLNGVYVNGSKVRCGSIVELCAGDKVTLVCKDKHGDIGFFIKRIIFQEEVAEQNSDGLMFERPAIPGSLSTGKVHKWVFASKRNDSLCVSGAENLVGRATSLVTSCRDIMQSDDPIAYLCQGSVSNSQFASTYASSSKLNDLKSSEVLPESVPVPVPVPDAAANPLKEITNHLHKQVLSGIGSKNTFNQNDTDISSKDGEHDPACGSPRLKFFQDNFVLPPGKKFFLNRLESMPSSFVGEDNVVSLRELLFPVESISKIFIATFTNDILWFFSYCNIPCHIPVTMVCHDTVKCWSTDTANRCSVPYSDFPNLVVVNPPFPEAIAFGQDNKKQGIACHHPKLIILQREENIRVIITSANLGERQWNRVTNTVWWQDFPRRNTVDYMSFFSQINEANASKGSSSDFVAQLAGFMGSLLTDVPIQAHWITELAKYDFSEANAYLIPSVPGMHTYKAHPVAHNIQNLHANQLKAGSSGMMFGSVETSVVGISHLYRRAVDSNGAQLKKLATFLKYFGEKSYGMSEVDLRRKKNVRADANAMSIFVPNPSHFSEEDCVQLGFLPRNIAKWVSPLWDAGFFRFTGYIWPKEALTSAMEGNGKKVQLVLHISQGPRFQEMSNGMEHEQVAAFCSLIGSIQRSTGLWRLEEVLGQYKWPEYLETDFSYGASSIGGSVNPKFLAAFSSAAGKKSVECFDSEESDPEWGCWNASHELKKPSIKVVYPTIDRLRTPQNGLVPSRYILCFAEKTWQRLKTTNILHDSVPDPPDRAGYPMHTKVARRRFSSRSGGASFGWVYCGSHNLSAAAWGRVISASPSAHPDAHKEGSSSSSSSAGGPKLHVCNYELGVVFIFPPPEAKVVKFNPAENLDDIALPFVVPPPKYGPRDRPATMQAMRDALAEWREHQLEHETEEGMTVEEEIIEAEEAEEAEEVEEKEASCYVEEKEEEKAYADMLWSQVD